MIFIETALFTRQVQALQLGDESYGDLQQDLADRPDAGDIVSGTGGVRKYRWALQGQGKRGGARVIYFWRVSEAQIILFAIYGKNDKANLTAAEKKALKQAIKAGGY